MSISFGVNSISAAAYALPSRLRMQIMKLCACRIPRSHRFLPFVMASTGFAQILQREACPAYRSMTWYSWLMGIRRWLKIAGGPDGEVIEGIVCVFMRLMMFN